MAETIERLAVLIEANTKSYERAMKRIEAKTNKATRASFANFKKLDRAIKKTGNSATFLSKKVIGIFGAGLAVRQVIDYADAWTRVTRSIQSTEEVFNVRLRNTSELAKLAVETRSDLESLSVLYTRTAAATTDLGISEKDVAKITTTLAKALKLGSASAAESDAVLRQFSQALQKGKLDGDEFRSVMENAGVVTKGLADFLGVTKGELLKLAADGKLRVEDLVGSLIQIAPKVDKAFAKSNATVAESFTNLSTRLIVLIGKLDEATSASEGLAAAFDFLSQGVDFVTPTSEFDKLKKELKSSEDSVRSLSVEYEKMLNSSFFSSFVTSQFKGSLDEATAKLNRIRAAIAAISSDNEGRLPDLPVKSNATAGKLPGALPRSRPKNLNELAFSPAKSKTDTAQSIIDALIFEQAQLQRNSTQQAVYNSLKAAGVALDSKQGETIRGLVVSLEEQAASQEDINNLIQDANELGRDVFGGIIQGMREGAKASDILANSLSRVGDRLANLALDSIFGGVSGGGLFASLFGGSASGGGLISGFKGVFANGGNIPAGGFGLVGERGPEFISGPATITPMNTGRGGGSQRVHVTVGISANSNGNIRPFVESVARNESAAAAAQVARSVPALVDARNSERETRRIRASR